MSKQLPLSCVSDRIRGPEFCLRGVQLLAAAAVTTVTRAVSGGRDERHKHSAVGCFGGGMKEDRVESRIKNNLCAFPCHFYLCVCLQHVLILVKVVLVVLIPDEPDWIRKKREHIEYKSMQALKEQVKRPPPNIHFII